MNIKTKSGDMTDVRMVRNLMRKRINSTFTFDLSIICTPEESAKIARRDTIEVDGNLFVIEDIYKDHSVSDVVKIDIYAEQVHYLLLEDGLDWFMEDKKEGYKQFKSQQEKDLQAFKDKQASDLATFLQTHTDQAEIDAYKALQAQQLQDFITAQTTADGNFEYVEKEAREVIEKILEGTDFTLRNCKTGKSSIRYHAKTNKAEILKKIANNWQGELNFDKYQIDFVDKIGDQNKNYRFAYKHNLKKVKIHEGKKGKTFDIDFVELASLPEYATLGFVNLGDSVKVEDQVLGLDIATRVIEIEYDVVKRRNTRVVLGEGVDYSYDYLEKEREVEKKVDTALNLLENWEPPVYPFEELEKKIDGIINNNLGGTVTEVVHTEVLSTQVMHALTAWIADLFVSKLQTNFGAMLPNRPETQRDYIDIEGMNIVFNTEILGTETEDLKINGQQLYWTAIGSEPEAHTFFTLTSPLITYKNNDTLTPEQNNANAQARELACRVKRKKSTETTTKMKIGFESLSGASGLFPMWIFGQGDGTPNGQKGYVYKDQSGFVIQYYKTDAEVVMIKLDQRGVTVINQGNTNVGQVRNIHVSNAQPDIAAMAEGDLWVVV